MRTIGFAALALVIATSALAEDTSQRPWESAQKVLDATTADLQSGGIRAIGPHVSDLEAALKTAIAEGQEVKTDGGVSYVLSDGSRGSLGNILIAAAAAQKTKTKSTTISVLDPYPRISLFLGSYYNEVGQPTDAARVLDVGIAVSDIDQLGLGETDSALLSEKATALIQLKQMDAALQTYEKGLAIGGLEDRDRARLYRGQGFVLTELGKLDDAEKAYNNSLTCEPGNQRAENELKYIAHLRTGAPATQTQLAVALPPNENAPKPTACSSE